METKNINELKANPNNPRRIETHDFNALVNSIKKFGDLSGIVLNVRTGQLVGGHQRIEAFKRLGGQPTITERYTEPKSRGTIAIGYVLLEDEKFGYREVDWDANFEKSANLAANRIQGQFNVDLVAQINYELSQLENGQELLEASGQSEQEIERLLKSVGAGPPDDPPADEEEKPDRLEFALTKDQREIVEEALGNIKATRELQAERNSSLNGSALYVICKDYLDQLHGVLDETPPEPTTTANA